MTSVVHLDLPGTPDVADLTAAVGRTAACLGAIGYGPHEVQRLTATELGLDPHVVARVMRSWRLDLPCPGT